MTRALVATPLLLVACAHAPLRLRYQEVDSEAMRRPMQVAVYTPPGWRRDEALPLVIFLHGAGDGPDAFDDNGIGQVLDAALARGDIPRAVVAVPDGELGFWMNWYDGSRSYEDWVLQDMLPAVQRDYGTLACPLGCHLVGISMGGAGTLLFLLHHPELFASAAALSAPVFDTQAMIDLRDSCFAKLFLPLERAFGPDDLERMHAQDVFLRWQRPADLGGVRLLLAWGDQEGERIAASSRKLAAHLEAHGIPHATVVFRGGHDWPSWTPVLLDALRTGVAQGAAQASDT